MATFNASYEGIGELLRSPMMQAEMKRRAEKVAAAAQALAPVGPPSDPTRGQYRDSFIATSGATTERAYGRVENATPYAAAIEFGNGRTSRKTIEAQHVLGKALDAAGD